MADFALLWFLFAGSSSKKELTPEERKQAQEFHRSIGCAPPDADEDEEYKTGCFSCASSQNEPPEPMKMENDLKDPKMKAEYDAFCKSIDWESPEEIAKRDSYFAMLSKSHKESYEEKAKLLTTECECGIIGGCDQERKKQKEKERNLHS